MPEHNNNDKSREIQGVMLRALMEHNDRKFDEVFQKFSGVYDRISEVKDSMTEFKLEMVKHTANLEIHKAQPCRFFNAHVVEFKEHLTKHELEESDKKKHRRGIALALIIAGLSLLSSVLVMIMDSRF